jgi:16S rRNA (adenine1518-N6/adenine1519-N6)-dimethyltransferase
MGDCILSLASSGNRGMDNPLTDPADQNIHTLLKQYGIKPSKNLGQNFLIDPVYLHQVAEAGEITQSDTVIEIGAGLGNLTIILARTAGEVIAFEIDSRFIPILESVTFSHKNTKIIQADILRVDLAQFTRSPGFLVVANIPYYITSKLIRHLLNGKTRPERIILTIQQEVAQRICAPAGKLSLLALSVQVYGSPQLIARIPAGAFYPVPNVDSAILRIDLYSSPKIKEDQLEIFFRIAKAGFSQKRKTLRNSLSGGLNLDRSIIERLLKVSQIDPNRRAETLSLTEWAVLTSQYCDLLSAEIPYFPRE